MGPAMLEPVESQYKSALWRFEALRTVAVGELVERSSAETVPVREVI